MTGAIVFVLVTLVLGFLLGHLHPPARRGRDVYMNGRRVDLVPLERFRTEARSPFLLREPAKPAGLTGKAWEYETGLLRRAAKDGKLGLPVTKPGVLFAVAAISAMALAWYVLSAVVRPKKAA